MNDYSFSDIQPCRHHVVTKPDTVDWAHTRSQPAMSAIIQPAVTRFHQYSSSSSCVLGADQITSFDGVVSCGKEITADVTPTWTIPLYTPCLQSRHRLALHYSLFILQCCQRLIAKLPENCVMPKNWLANFFQKLHNVKNGLITSHAPV